MFSITPFSQHLSELAKYVTWIPLFTELGKFSFYRKGRDWKDFFKEGRYIAQKWDFLKGEHIFLKGVNLFD